jgi:DNA-binding NtrC family response regulator
MSTTHLTFPGLTRSPNHDLPPSAFPVEQHQTILLGDSVAVQQLRSQINRVAPYLRTALIRGEIGVGKQFVARAIHALSSGADGPFIVCDASALVASIASGGRSTTPAAPAAGPLLESAQGGTLYLDGIGKLSPALQAALFRFIRACDERRSAGAQTSRAGFRRADTRILAASDRNLRTLAAIGQFRQDLYARLSVVEIFVPPLRQRIEDIPILAAWLLRRLADRAGQSPRMLAESTLALLQGRSWPDNLNELDRVVCQAAALAEGDLIEPRHLFALVEPAHPSLAPASAVKIERLHDVIRQHVLEVLTRCGGNKLRAAELLGISRSTLYRMLDASVSADPLSE